MMKKLKSQQKTIAEKVADIITHHNESDSGSDSADEATAAKVVEYNDNEYELPSTQSTEFRKRNVKLLSEQNIKYKGKVVCRRELESDRSEDEKDFDNSNSSDDEPALAAFGSDLNGQNKHKNRYSNSENEDVSGSENESEDSGDYEDNNDDEDSEIDDEQENEVISGVNHEVEMQKGLCVQNQLHIWERLLEIRINLQKILNKTNQLPSAHELKDLEKNMHKDVKATIRKNTCVLLQNLLSLKNNLSTQFPEVENKMKPVLKRALPFKDTEVGEPSLKQANQLLEDNFKQFSPYRNDVLLKWDDRTKLLQPGAGSVKKSFNEEYDIIKKIENALINKTLLIEKSQQFKAAAAQNETQQESKTNANIYDDSDFYHQQLRELIEYKANTTTNMSEVTKQFVELQKLRQKMKKKVDNRASKGRKLRYVVHNKLINFMAPHNNCTWTMESTDELSKSLFV